MSIAALILGESGTGKSTSLRTLDPSKTLLIQAIKKPLPFKATGWKTRASLKSEGNVIQTDDAHLIEKLLRQSPHDIVVIDDFQLNHTNREPHMSSYSLDTNQARKADQRGGVINETGKYIGKLLRAEDIETDKGTKGIDFSFMSRDGQKTRFALYTGKRDGARINIGHGFVMALMTCLGLRDIKPMVCKVKKWDQAANAEVDSEAPCFPDLMNKEIGLLLESEQYEKSDGTIGKRMVLAGVFQAATELTATEILDRKAKPEQLTKIVATLRDRQLRPSKGGAPTGGASRPVASGGGFDDMDDDIPF